MLYLKYAKLWDQIGHVTLVAIAGTTIRVPVVMKSRHCNSFEDQAHVIFFFVLQPGLNISMHDFQDYDSLCFMD